MNSYDKKIAHLIKEDTTFNYTPLFYFGGFSIERKSSYWVELIETEPYALDGEVPLIMINFWRFSYIFESKKLYRYIYKKRYNVEPRGLDA